MNRSKVTAPLLAALLGLAACTPSAQEADELLARLDQNMGKRVVLKARFRSGARCRVGENEGEWKTYCKGDCQFCKGPLVVDSRVKGETVDLDDWPLTLGGTFEGKPIRCEGPLNEVKCYPFEPGKTYVVRGLLEKNHPPRLMVSEFWEADE
jgi:hypothetical protein